MVVVGISFCCSRLTPTFRRSFSRESSLGEKNESEELLALVATGQ
jgi:hypothetical protein